METTTKVIVTDQMGRERENMNDRERQREHTHTHTRKKISFKRSLQIEVLQQLQRTTVLIYINVNESN